MALPSHQLGATYALLRARSTVSVSLPSQYEKGDTIARAALPIADASRHPQNLSVEWILKQAQDDIPAAVGRGKVT